MIGDQLANGGQAPEAYLVFEGGGAKGFVHIGALRALESKVRIIGVAGTSAGAMIASLVAAGYRSDELVDPDGAWTLLDTLGVGRATALFGNDGGWGRVSRLRRLLANPHHFWRHLLPMLRPVAGAALLFGAVGWCAGAAMDRAFDFSQAIFAGLGLGLALTASVLRGLYVGLLDTSSNFARGLASTKTIARVLNDAYLRALRAKGKAPLDGIVRFRDLIMPLTVIATRLDQREMAEFSNHLTPDTPVSHAVAASICLPIVFSPAEIGDDSYYDGGLVSNLPVWAFDQERRSNPEAYTIALEIADPEAPKEHPLHQRWPHLGQLFNAARAALFGGKVLNFRAVDRLCICSLPASIGVLDFDRSLADINGMINRGVVVAKSAIIHNMFTVPGLYRAYCQGLRDTVMQAIDVLEGQGSKPSKVRVAVALSGGGRGLTLRLVYGAGFDDCPDDELELPVEGSLAGKAYKENKSIFAQVPFEADCNLSLPKHKRIRARIWPGMKWSFVTPISVREDVVDLVLCVDGDGEYQYFLSLLNEPFWGQHIEQLKAVHGKAYQPSEDASPDDPSGGDHNAVSG